MLSSKSLHGRIGGIAVAGGGIIVYWGRPEESAQSVCGQSIFTDDLGYLDRDSSVHVRGRASETLNRGGESWYPCGALDAALE